jgi:hypothetical protein
MKKVIASIIALVILAACSRKQKDFVGVYNFQVMDSYYVTDTTEYTVKFFSKEYIKLKVNKLAPLKIDLFENGEELKGTFSVTSYQENFGLGIRDNKKENKADLKNIHLINDTLFAEVGTSKKTLQIKIVKSSSDANLILKASTQKDIEKESCNKLAAISGVDIVYKVLNGASNEADLIKASNQCEIEKSVRFCLDNGYKKEKKVYLEKILSVNPK